MITNVDAPTFLTVSEARRRVHVSEKTMWAWIHEGRVPAVKPGKAWLIPVSALTALVERAHDEAAARACVKGDAEVMA